MPEVRVRRQPSEQIQGFVLASVLQAASSVFGPGLSRGVCGATERREGEIKAVDNRW